MKKLFLFVCISSFSMQLLAYSGTPDDRKKSLKLPEPITEQISVPLSQESESFLTKATYYSAALGGIAGLVYTANRMTQSSNIIQISSPTGVVYATNQMTQSSNIIKHTLSTLISAGIAGWVGHTLAKSTLLETKIENKINGDIATINQFIHKFKRINAQKLEIDKLKNWKDPDDRLHVYKTLKKRPYAAWLTLKALAADNWNQLYNATLSHDQIKELNQTQKDAIENKRIALNEKYDQLLTIASPLKPAITKWAKNTGDSMDEIKKDRLYTEITQKKEALRSLQDSRATRRLITTLGAALGTESGISSYNPGLRSSAKYQQKERLHQEKQENAAIQNMKNSISINIGLYNGIQPSEVFNSYFSEAP